MDRLCNKDVAALCGNVSVRTVSRRAKLLGMTPTYPLHSHNEWSAEDAAKLDRKWQAHVRKQARLKLKTKK